jgi:hypothetical protein
VERDPVNSLYLDTVVLISEVYIYGANNMYTAAAATAVTAVTVW